MDPIGRIDLVKGPISLVQARPEIVLQDLLGRQHLDTLSDEAGGQRGADVRGPVD